MVLPLLAQRAVISLTTFPTINGWYQVVGITLATTATAGLAATGTGFVDPIRDWEPTNNPFRPVSAFFSPSLVEEVFWRGALLPTPASFSTTSSSAAVFLPWAGAVLVAHVLSHPLAAATVWPRGRGIFQDPRFLFLATIVLGGATASYIVSGGSVWAAALTHGVPVALWRDFFGGERRLAKLGSDNSKTS
jgi:predicted Abi (CAAX) family protease